MCMLFHVNWMEMLSSYKVRPCIGGVSVMVFNTTFNNFQLYRGGHVLLVEETGEPGENHRPVVSH
jgi:hypothetical protein